MADPDPFQDRKTELSKSAGILDLSPETFLQLGHVMDWLEPHAASLLASAQALDKTIIDVVQKLRVEYESDPSALDARLASIAYDPKRPATFVWNHLVRGLVVDAKGHPPKKGDGRDLCHAVVGAAYGSFAALDKHWKRRIEALPKPNGVARIYYAPELDKLVADLEQVRQRHVTANFLELRGVFLFPTRLAQLFSVPYTESMKH